MSAIDGGNGLGDFDPSTPSVARIYDYALGGKNWFEIDRQVFEHLKKVVPHQAQVGVANRRWLERVVRYVTKVVGIDQILDLGSGLPTQKNTHEVAQEFNAEVAVVYVDNDPVCVTRRRRSATARAGPQCRAGTEGRRTGHRSVAHPRRDRAVFRGFGDVPAGPRATARQVARGPAVRAPWPDEQLIVGGLGRKP